MYVETKDIKAILSTVQDPELGLDIVELGMVGEIVIGLDHIEIEIALTTLACPLRAVIQKSITQKIIDKLGQTKVNFRIIEMNPDQKKRAMALARSFTDSVFPVPAGPSGAPP